MPVYGWFGLVVEVLRGRLDIRFELMLWRRLRRRELELGWMTDRASWLVVGWRSGGLPARPGL